MKLYAGRERERERAIIDSRECAVYNQTVSIETCTKM